MRTDFIKIRTMRYIVMLADGATVGEVARRCSVTSPCVSIAVNRVEQMMGVQIFKRKAKRIAGLAPEGREVVEDFRRVIEAADKREAA